MIYSRDKKKTRNELIRYISDRVEFACVLIANWCGWLLFVDHTIIQGYISKKRNEISHDRRCWAKMTVEEKIVVAELTLIFKFERMVYIYINLISFVMLIGSVLSIILKEQGGIAELTTLFGSSGMITYSTGRLLYIWNEALEALKRDEKDEELLPSQENVLWTKAKSLDTLEAYQEYLCRYPAGKFRKKQRE